MIECRVYCPLCGRDVATHLPGKKKGVHFGHGEVRISTHGPRTRRCEFSGRVVLPVAEVQRFRPTEYPQARYILPEERS